MSQKHVFLTLAVCFSMAARYSAAQTANQTNRSTGTPPPQTTGSGTPGTFSGRIAGTDMDGATVTLTNKATGQSRSAVTDSSGAFTISNLEPGSYRATVRLRSGLQLEESSVDISPNNSNSVQVTFNALNAAPAGGNTEIEGVSPTVQSHSAEVSRSYGSQFIRSLPLIDRQNQELITLMPGITPPVTPGSLIDDPQRSRTFNVNGQPAYTNIYNQDGAYDTEPFTNRPLRTEPNEAVEALEVRTSNYNAEYGYAAGSWASTITRPGTNALHGSLFGEHTNSYFRTGREYQATQSDPRFNMNQFGASAGGAIIPDRMFWFLSYEGRLRRGNDEDVATVPTAGFASGNFSGIPGLAIYNPASGNAAGLNRTVFPGNVIPANGRNAAARQTLAMLPAPNAPGFSNNLVGNVPLLEDNHRIDGKLDHRFSERSTGFLRYGYTQASVDQGSLLGLLGSPLNSEFRGMNAVGSYTHIFTTDLLSEFRFGYDRYRNRIAPWGDFSSLNGAFTGFPNGLPSINIAGFSPIGMPANVPRKEISNVYDGANNWQLHKGMHSLKFGVEVKSLQSNGFVNPAFSAAGSFFFGPGGTLGSTASSAGLSASVLQANALAAFLSGAPNESGVTSYLTTPAYRQMQYSAYVTDTVNLMQKLYLELGVRYDIFSPVEAAQPGGQVTYDPGSNTVTTLGMNGGSNRAYRTDLNNVAPRIGLAFRPVNRFVFRAGYGIHYFALPFYQVAFNPAVQGIQSGITGGLGTTAFAIPNVNTTTVNYPYAVTGRGVPTPYVQTFSGMVQGDLGNGFLMDVGYVGNLGRQLSYNLTNAGLPGSGLSFLPPGQTALYTQYGSGLTSNYNSLQVNLTKKFAAGLSLAAAYTWSKALDYGTSLADPYNRRNNYGVADWDRQHVLTVSHDWRLPFGGPNHRNAGIAAKLIADWELTGILRWATGTPYTVTADPLACACFGVNAVPANFARGTQINGQASFDPSLFTTPAAGTFGNFSRNPFRGPDMFTYNAALFRNFAIRENVKLEFRGEVYNLTNTTNLRTPVSSLLTPGYGTSLGTIDGMAGRQFQVGARILF